MKNRVETLVKILDSKVDEGLEELPKMAVKTEDYTICLNNILSSLDLLNKLTYVPKPEVKPTVLDTKTISKN